MNEKKVEKQGPRAREEKREQGDRDRKREKGVRRRTGTRSIHGMRSCPALKTAPYEEEGRSRRRRLGVRA